MFGNLFNQKKYVVKTETQTIGGIPLGIPITQQTEETVIQEQQPPAIAPPQQPANIVGASMGPSQRQDMSVLSQLDPRTTQVLNLAQQEATKIKQQFIEPEQILLGLLFDGEIFQLLEQFSVNAANLAREIQSKEKEGTFVGQPTLSDNSKKIFELGYSIVKNRKAEFITPEDLLAALTSANVAAAEYLQQQGLDKQKLQDKLAKTNGIVENQEKKGFLDKFGTDLTALARKGDLDPVAGRDKEIERMIHILLRRIKNNPIIIGEAGVGKTAVVEGLAQAIVSGSVPKDLQNKRIIQIDVASLVAGASHRGEFEERLRDVIKEAQMSNGQVIIFIDEIHTLIGTGESDGALDASNIIKPFLARGQLQIIGSTTTLEYRKYFEKDKAFERRFQTVLVEEPDEENAMKMIEILKPKYENFHHVVITPEAIEASVKLSKRYIGERYLPDKAVDVIDEGAAEVRLQNASGKRSDHEVKKPDIEKVIASWTGIPISKLTEDESAKLLHLEDLIHKRLINQETAVRAVAEAVRRGRIGLANAMRPIASFIFLGPTGTGKTELAKTLAEILFGKEEAMTRLDMSEYMEKHEVSKLIGAPPGYVGYEEGGQLTEAVRMKPYSVVLLDEVEKAHPDVFNILLQLLEDGRLTDNKGNTISFKNTIVIATSNIGSAMIQQYLMADAAKEESEKKKDTNVVLDAKVIEDKIDELTAEKPAAAPAAKPATTGMSSAAAKKDDKMDKKEEELKTTITKLLGEALGKIANPALIPTPAEKQQYETVKSSLEQETQSGNPLAQAILNAASSPADILYQDALYTVLKKIANPAAMQSINDQQLYKNLKETLEKNNKEGNPLSALLVKATDTIVKAGIIGKTKDEEEAEKKQQKLKELYQVVMGELHKFFKPELLNRFDEVIIFEPLTRKNMHEIAKLRINATRKLLKEQGIDLDLTDKALNELAKEGYDPVYGARPLRRLVQSTIENPIASLILGKTFAGGDTILIDYSDKEEKFTFTKTVTVKPAQPAAGATPPVSGAATPPTTIPQANSAANGQTPPAQQLKTDNPALPTSSTQPYVPTQNPAQPGIIPQQPRADGNAQPQSPNQPYRIVLELNNPPAPAGTGVAQPLPTTNTNSMASSS